MACRAPGEEPALLEAALAVIAAPLPRTAPLWSAVLVTGLADGSVALVLVLHHALRTVSAGWRSWFRPRPLPDPGTLTGALRGELDQIVGHPAVQPWP